jgi:hypothetical protein
VTELFTLTPLLTTQLELPLLMMLVVLPGAPFPMAFMALVHGSSSDAGWASTDPRGVKMPIVAAAMIPAGSSQRACRRDPVMSSPLRIQDPDPSRIACPVHRPFIEGFGILSPNLVETTNDIDDCNTAQESAVGSPL